MRSRPLHPIRRGAGAGTVAVRAKAFDFDDGNRHVEAGPGRTAHDGLADVALVEFGRSEEHTSELQSPMRTPSAAFCLKNKHTTTTVIAYSRQTCTRPKNT